MTDQEFMEACAPIVQQVSASLARRMPVDRDDLEQECWLWCTKRRRRMDSLLARKGAMVNMMARDVRVALASRSEAVACKRTYSDRELAELLRVALTPTLREKATDGWEAAFAALCGALAQSSEQDQQVLVLRAVERLPFSEVADRLGIGRQAAERRYSRALRRLSSAFEEPAVEEEGVEYVGTRVVPSRSHAAMITAGTGHEPGPRRAGMRRIE